jgi:16S rRNA (cytidine1402-2'-O)-methyltransferase
MPGTLFVVATPIGNLEDITARALRVLRDVSLIAAEDTRRTAHLLARYAITTPTTSLHEHNESKKASALVERLKQGSDIALVSDAGTPTVSDPGHRFIRAAIDAGIRVEPVPGPSAVLAALAASGLSTETFIFLGFPPTRSKDRKRWFERLVASEGTVVFFEAPHRIRRTLERLQELIGDQPIVVARELTKVHEELVRGPISVVLGALGNARGELTVLLEFGHSTELTRPPPPDASQIQSIFGDLTNNNALSRRGAISEIARKYGMSVRDVYEAIEKSKK